MKTLFEIPIYAIKRDVLHSRVEKTKEKHIKECVECHHLKPDSDEIHRSLEMLTYPMCVWEYNHIIGYLRISIDAQDVLFDTYLPMNQVERYHWDSKVKHFVVNQMEPNNHFYIGNKSSNEIRDRITDYLNDYCKRMDKRGYQVDLDAFNTLHKYIDYKMVAEKEV